jgi:hypothetical protein
MEKRRLPIMFFGAVALLLFLYLNHLYSIRSMFDVNNLLIEEINAIVIEDVGKKSIEITDQAKVIQMAYLIKSSVKTPCDSSKGKVKNDLYKITIRPKSGAPLHLLLSKSKLTAGLIRSGEYCYQT